MTSAPVFKPRDLVTTPTGRRAEVINIRSDGRRDLEYKDEEGGFVTLPREALKLVHEAKVKPWPSRIPP